MMRLVLAAALALPMAVRAEPPRAEGSGSQEGSRGSDEPALLKWMRCAQW